jgi:ATP-dependent DNA helicase RecG
MDAMYLLDFVKAAREGTRRMRASMKEYGLPEPTFVQEAVHGLLVRVELKNNAEYRRKAGAADVVEYYGHSLWTKLTEDERKAAEIALRNGAINVSETQRATSRSWQTSKRILIRMAKRGMLTHVHDDSERDTKAFFVPRKPNEQE